MEYNEYIQTREPYKIAIHAQQTWNWAVVVSPQSGLTPTEGVSVTFEDQTRPPDQAALKWLEDNKFIRSQFVSVNPSTTLERWFRIA